MTPEEKTQAAMKAAWDDFAKQGEAKYFGSPRANRFFVQPLNDGTATLVLGAAGTITREDGEVEPVATVITAVNVDPAFLQNLCKIIDLYYPKTGSAA